MTPRQLEEFRTRGYLSLNGRLGEDELAALGTDAQEILARTPLSDQRVTAWRLATGEAYVLKIKPVVDLSSAARGMANDLTGIASTLLGGPAELIDDKISYKQKVPGEPPDRTLGEEVHKHTDAAYYRRRGFTEPVITLAVCMDDCPAEAGAVRVWPGSHLQKIVHEQTADHGPVVPATTAPDAESVTLTAKAGAILAWDGRLVHASGSNTTGRPRRLLILGYTR